MINVAIHSEARLWRAGVRKLLTDYRDLRVVVRRDPQPDRSARVHEAAAGDSVDVVLYVAFRLSGHALAQARGLVGPPGRTSRRPGLLLLAERLSEEESVRALEAGATGLLLAESDPDELHRAIHVVARGGWWLPQEAAVSFAQSTHRGASGGRADADALGLVALLTEREREVLTLLGAGETNRAIGERLSVSSETIKDHIASLYAKLGVRNRVHAAQVAWQVARRAEGQSSVSVPVAP